MFYLLKAAPKIDLFQHFRPFAWVIPVIIILYLANWYFKSPKFKGWIGEKLVNFAALKKLDKQQYKIMHDLYIPHHDGHGTAQIDHLVVSQFGVFVIETKNYQHWIFGSETQNKWTQKIYKQSNQFQNPINQNKSHIKSLSQFLKVDPYYFHNLVFFVGECTFKTDMPDYVRNKDFRKYIESFQTPIMDQEQIDFVYNTLTQHDQGLNRKKVARDHVKFIKSRKS